MFVLFEWLAPRPIRERADTNIIQTAKITISIKYFANPHDILPFLDKISLLEQKDWRCRLHLDSSLARRASSGAGAVANGEPQPPNLGSFHSKTATNSPQSLILNYEF